MRDYNKRVFVSVCAAVVLSSMVLGGCGEREPEPGNTSGVETEAVRLNRYDASFLQLFDTVTTLTGYARDEDEFRGYAEMFRDELAEYHKLYDIYNSYEGINNIKTINEYAGIEPVKVDRRIIELLDFSREMYEISGGTFNIAMGSVLSVWHDYRTEGIDNPSGAELPPMDVLRAAAEHMDMDKIVIDYDASTVYLEDPDMRLDVGAVAKGYAAEQICLKLEAQGVDHLLASVGGNIRAIGAKDDGSKWRVGIQNPDIHAEMKYLHRVDIEDMSLVTSGSYERYYTVEGKTYHHIIHPETLMPWDEFVSVSILCQDSGQADVLSTAIFNLPLDEGKALIEELDHTEAMWIEADGTEHYSSGFQAYMED